MGSAVGISVGTTWHRENKAQQQGQGGAAKLCAKDKMSRHGTESQWLLWAQGSHLCWVGVHVDRTEVRVQRGQQHRFEGAGVDGVSCQRFGGHDLFWPIPDASVTGTILVVIPLLDHFVRQLD